MVELPPVMVSEKVTWSGPKKLVRFSSGGFLVIPGLLFLSLNINWKRLAQFTQSKVTLLQRSTGLLCTAITEVRLSSHP